MMNKVEEQNLLLISEKFKNILMSIITFTDILKKNYDKFVPEDNKEMLMIGSYGRLNSANLWVSRMMARSLIKVSNEVIANSKEESKWSPPLSLKNADKFESLFNMKAFW